MPVRSVIVVAWLVAVAPGCSFDSSGRAGGDEGPGLGGDEPGDPAPIDESDAGGEPVTAPASCAEALASGVDASGVVVIDPGGGGEPFPVHCDMQTDGGGWTLALKADGQRATFRYTSSLWTTAELLNPDAPALDHTEAKLDSFNRVPFQEVLIRFDTEVGTGGDYESRWVWMDLAGDSLLSLFAAGDYVPVYLGRQRWLGAVPEATLQENCNREGINAGVFTNRVRLGIVANDDDDCLTLDSKLGVGHSYSCQSCSSCEDGSGLAGPAAGSNDAGCWRVVSFASLLVR